MVVNELTMMTGLVPLLVTAVRVSRGGTKGGDWIHSFLNIPRGHCQNIRDCSEADHGLGGGEQ